MSDVSATRSPPARESNRSGIERHPPRKRHRNGTLKNNKEAKKKYNQSNEKETFLASSFVGSKNIVFLVLHSFLQELV